MNGPAADSGAERLVTLLLERFPGREDIYLDERRNKVDEPLTEAVVADHLCGRKRIGIYPLDDRTAYLGFDFDGKNLPGGADEAWEQLQAVANVLIHDLGFTRVVAEITRSGKGYRLLVFFDPNDRPDVKAVKQFGKLVLRYAGLPADEREENGHPGIYPHPAGPKGVGKTCFLPLGSLFNGNHASRFLDLATREPVDRQESALEDAELISPERLQKATHALEAMIQDSPDKEHPARPEPEKGGSWGDVPENGQGHPTLKKLIGDLRNLHTRERTLALTWAMACQWNETGMRKRKIGSDEVRSLVDWHYGHEARRVETEYDRTEREAPAEIKITSMADLLDTPPQPETWIAAGLVARKKSTGLAAKRKGGKSKTCHRLCLDVAAEREFALDYEPFRILNPGPVLWLDMEQGRDELASLSHRLIAGGEYSRVELQRIRAGIHWKTREQRIDFADEEDLRDLQRIVQTEGIVLTIIDSISAVQAFYGSENDNSGRRRMYNKVIAPLLDLGTGVIAFGHTAIAHSDSGDDVELRTRGGGDVLCTFDANCYIVGTRHEREHGDTGRVIRTIASLGTLESRGADFDRCRIVLDGVTPETGEIPGALKVYAESILVGIGEEDVRDVNRTADNIVAAVGPASRFRNEVAKSLRLDSGDKLFRNALRLAISDGRLIERPANQREKDLYRQGHPRGGNVPAVLEGAE